LWAFVLAGHHLAVEPWPVVVTLSTVIALPLGLGQALRPWLGGWADRQRGHLNTVATLALLTAMWGIFSQALAHGVALAPAVLVALIIGIAGLYLGLLATAWTWFGRLGFARPQRIAAAICGSQRTAAMGLPVLAVLLHGDPAIGLCLAPLVIFHISQNILTGLLTSRLRGPCITASAATVPPSPCAPCSSPPH
jgi:sodium/bile acid cotransporter 7